MKNFSNLLLVTKWFWIWKRPLGGEQWFFPFLNVLPQMQEIGRVAQAFPAVFQHRSALLLPLPVLGHWHPEQMIQVHIRERVKKGQLERKEEIKWQSKEGETLHPGSITVHQWKYLTVAYWNHYKNSG